MPRRVMGGRLLIAAAAAYFAGRRYCVFTNYNVPGTDNTVVDVAAVLPRLKELKSRLKRGFAPTGILAHLIGSGWVPVKEIAQVTGYNLAFVAKVLEEAMGQGWVEIDITGPEARCRIKDYRVPAKECILAFSGAEQLERKLAVWRDLAKRCSGAYFIFPYGLDAKTTDLIVSTGAGIMQYYEDHGIFQEIVPADLCDIEDEKGFALMTERILYDDIWVKVGEII